MLAQIPPKRMPRPGDGQLSRQPHRGTIQDVRPMPRTAHRVAVTQPIAQPVPVAPSLPRRFTTKSVAKTPQKSFILWVQTHSLLLIAPLIIFASIRLSTMPIVGEIILAVYGITALLLRKPSRLSFWLATIVLISIGIEFLLLPGDNRANNSALFVFTLLGIGLVSMIFENRRMRVQNKPTRRR